MTEEELILISDMKGNCLKAIHNEGPYIDAKAKEKYLALLHLEKEYNRLKHELEVSEQKRLKAIEYVTNRSCDTTMILTTKELRYLLKILGGNNG